MKQILILILMMIAFPNSPVVYAQILELSPELYSAITLLDQDQSGCWRYLPRTLSVKHDGPGSIAAITFAKLGKYTKVTLLMGGDPVMPARPYQEMQTLRTKQRLCPAQINSLEAHVVFREEYGSARMTAAPQNFDHNDQYFQINLYLNQRGFERWNEILKQGGSWSDLLLMQIKLVAAPAVAVAPVVVTIDPDRLHQTIQTFLGENEVIDETQRDDLVKVLQTCLQSEQCGLRLSDDAKDPKDVDEASLAYALQQWLSTSVLIERIRWHGDFAATFEFRLRESSMLPRRARFDVANVGASMHYSALGLFHCFVHDQIRGLVRRSDDPACQ